MKTKSMKRAIDIDKIGRIKKEHGEPIHRRKSLGEVMMVVKRDGRFESVKAEMILELYGYRTVSGGASDLIVWVHMKEEPFPHVAGYRVGNFKLYGIKMYKFGHGLDVYGEIDGTKEAMAWLERSKNNNERGSL